MRSCIAAVPGEKGGHVLVDVQRTGRIFGWLFIGTFVTSIPARLLLRPRSRRELERHALRSRGHVDVALGAGVVLEFGLIVTQIGTAIVIYPLVRRQSETVSLGYVAAGIMESVFAAIGIMSIISVVNIADTLSGASGATALRRSAHKAIRSCTRTSGRSNGDPDSSWGIGNGLMLGYLMYRSALVPRRLALLGLVGGSLLIVSFVLTLCDVYDNGSTMSGLLTLPEAAWELMLGIYCAWKGSPPRQPARETRSGDGSVGARAPSAGGPQAGDRHRSCSR